MGSYNGPKIYELVDLEILPIFWREYGVQT